MVKNNFTIKDVNFGQYNQSIHTEVYVCTYIQKHRNIVNSSIETELSADHPKEDNKNHSPHT
jgi:hypothetical protein